MAAARAWVAILLGSMAGLPASAQFVREDIEICPLRADLLDPEFSPDGRQAVYLNSIGELRVMALRPNGLPGPGGCSGTLVDNGALLKLPDLSFRQGAEWAMSLAGPEIHYTKLDADGMPALARAWHDGSAWQTEWLPRGSGRGLPVASQDAADAQPRIMYLTRLASGKHVPTWREVGEPLAEAAFPGSGVPDSGAVPRWVAGERAIATARLDADGRLQATIYAIDTRQTTWITSGPADVDEVWVWAAPEFGGERVMIAIENRCCLVVRREFGGLWPDVQRLDAAVFSGLSSIFSPEPFVHGGRSYVAMQIGNKKYDNSQIWITGIDAEQPMLRIVSDPETPGVRGEPEWVVTSTGVYVYYSLFEGGKHASLRRAATGLE